MKSNRKASRLVLAFQLAVNACHITLHHFALHLLWTSHQRPTALSKLLIYTGGFSSIVILGMIGSQLQRRSKLKGPEYPGYVDLGITRDQSHGAKQFDELVELDADAGKIEGVISMIISFMAESLTLYLVQ